MQVVAPADTDISGLGIEVAVGVQEGLSFDGVLRFVFPRPGFTPCTIGSPWPLNNKITIYGWSTERALVQHDPEHRRLVAFQDQLTVICTA